MYEACSQQSCHSECTHVELFKSLLSFTRWVLHAVELQTLFYACRTSLTAFFFCCFFSGGYDRMSGFGLLCAFKGWFLESCVGLEQKTTTIWWFFGAQIWRGWPKLVSDWVFFYLLGWELGFFWSGYMPCWSGFRVLLFSGFGTRFVQDWLGVCRFRTASA